MLLVALGWKIAIQPDDPNYLKEDLVKFLERKPFQRRRDRRDGELHADHPGDHSLMPSAGRKAYPRWIEPGSHSTYCCRHRSLVRRLSRRGVRPTASIMDSGKLPLVQISSRAWID